LGLHPLPRKNIRRKQLSRVNPYFKKYFCDSGLRPSPVSEKKAESREPGIMRAGTRRLPLKVGQLPDGVPQGSKLGPWLFHVMFREK